METKTKSIRRFTKYRFYKHILRTRDELGNCRWIIPGGRCAREMWFGPTSIPPTVYIYNIIIIIKVIFLKSQWLAQEGHIAFPIHTLTGPPSTASSRHRFFRLDSHQILRVSLGFVSHLIAFLQISLTSFRIQTSVGKNPFLPSGLKMIFSFFWLTNIPLTSLWSFRNLIRESIALSWTSIFPYFRDKASWILFGLSSILLFCVFQPISLHRLLCGSNPILFRSLENVFWVGLFWEPIAFVQFWKHL